MKKGLASWTAEERREEFGFRGRDWFSCLFFCFRKRRGERVAFLLLKEKKKGLATGGFLFINKHLGFFERGGRRDLSRKRNRGAFVEKEKGSKEKVCHEWRGVFNLSLGAALVKFLQRKGIPSYFLV